MGSKEGTFCDRCFASIGKGETYCPECGAPVGEAAPAADSAVHGELAQANLLRLRGDLDASEKALLAILRRFPNDPHAHEMLGDVCADRGEADRAIEWYELALDLAPNASDARRKLQAMRERLEARDTAETAEQIGLPPTTAPAAWWPLALAAGILVIAIVVAAWPHRPASTPYLANVAAPLPEAPVEDPTPKVEPVTPTPEPTPTPAVPALGTEQDRQLLAELHKTTEGARVQSVATDPRGTIDLTYEVADTDDAKALAVTLGKAALDAAPAATSVTLRAVKASSLVFAADLARTALESAEPLTNVWPAPAAPPASDPSNGSATTTPTPNASGSATAPPSTISPTTSSTSGA